MTLFRRSALCSHNDPPCRTALSSTGARVAKACLAGAALLVASAPRTASADLASDRVDFFMYGRMGVSWTFSGQTINGKNMNLGDHRALGGRLEEGDYLEPGFKFHVLKGVNPTDTTVDVVTSVEMFSLDSSFVSDFANGDINQLRILPEQAYVEAQNVFTEGLTIWGGARLYRAADIHIADYFYFNSLPGEGIGVKYKGFEAAVLQKTSGSPFYNADLNPGAVPPADPHTVKRSRTIVAVQYKQPFGQGSTFVQGLAEAHLVPKSADGNVDAPKGVNPNDFGAAVGAKLHLDLGHDGFNDTSFRFGTGIANGAEGGGATFDTFGAPSTTGRYTGAFGIEAVDHFLMNFGPLFTLNAYGVLHYSQDARNQGDLDPNSRFNFAVGVRPIIYAHNQFHVITEASFQGRKDAGLDMGTAVKLSVAPTIVPTGERNAWARPHIRLIYTAGFYNQAAVDQLMSPYLQTVGETKYAHYIGTRTEWWF